MECYVIQEWAASYYSWESRTWINGKLNLCPKYICFFDNNSESNSSPIVTADLRRITSFQRRSVSLIYKAIVVGIEGEKSLWFSSLNNREEVYYFLEHFWKQRLLCLGPGVERKQQSRHNESTASSTSKSQRKQLFEMLYDSETTLMKASNTLYEQGEQLDHSSQTMNKMHQDLNITETLVHGLDKWFTKWNVNPEQYYEIQTRKEYPILYRKTTKDIYSPGTLVFLEGQVTVLDIKRVADVSILLKDLTSIIVNTPWNILLIRSVIGEIDVLIDISSAQVVYVLKSLQSEHGDKFQYEDATSDNKKKIVIPEIPSTVNLLAENHEGGLTSADDADLQAVGDVVDNLKSLAVGVNQEMTRQLGSLDQLSESVDKANHRIKTSSRKVERKL